ncbi:MAG: glycosyltransferase family 1 protein [Candidatus Electrothrix sp. ATG2]|nr:glycosyltransferase family 1 protein [Candidatus Electrothrix sp. ATG2]
MKKKCEKVLHLRSSGGLLGAENVILEIANHSERFGYTSVIGVLHDSRGVASEMLTVARSYGLETHSFFCNSRLDFKAIKKINNIVSTNSIRLLHCHGYKEDVYGILAQAGVPLLATNHLWKTNSLMLHFYKIIDAFLMRYFNMVTGVSDEIVAEMQKKGIKKALKVANGVDIRKYNVNERSIELINKLGLDQDKVVFGMISSLTPEKNHSCAISAFASLNDTVSQLLIVGDGPLLEELKDLAVSMNISERVFFVGRRSNINEILSVVDVFLLPSLMEGLPMALLEAMACGKAVIVSRVGENANVVENNMSGILVESGDVAGLADAMQLMIKRSDLRKEFGQQARKVVKNKFSSEIMTYNYCQLYDQLLAGSTPKS